MTSEALSPGQRAVLSVFFSRPESAGYLIAGGTALLAIGLSSRPTRDIDVFRSGKGSGVATAVRELTACQG